MTAADPDVIDTAAWLKKTRRRLSVPPTNRDLRKWTSADFKLSFLLADKLTKDELLTILDIATNKRFDRLNQIETFLTMMAGYIDGRTDDGEK